MAGARFNRRGLMRSGARLGSGSANYTDFDSTGMQTMQGTARVYRELWVPASEFITVAAGSANMTSGSTYFQVAGADFHTRTLTPTADNAAGNAEWCGMAPQDVCSSGSVIPVLEVMPTTVLGNGSDMAKPILKYSYVDALSGSTSTGSVAATTASLNPGVVGTRISITLPSIPSFTAGQMMKFLVQFPASSASANSASRVGLVGLRLKYISDRLGQQTS